MKPSPIMTSTDDAALVRAYAEYGSEQAFATLVSRHVNLVYSVALRKTGNPHSAEEITQAVFIVFARKARALRNGRALSSWFYQTARFAAANYLRSELRRSRREQEAYMQSLTHSSEPDPWPQIAPQIEDAVGILSDTDRAVIVLRFFENKSLDEVAAALGVSPEAAKKRVARAVERLRVFFGKRGAALSAVLIVSALGANAVQAAPAGLAAATSSAVLQGTSAASAAGLAKSILQDITWMKLKAGAIAAFTVLATGVGITLVLPQTRESRMPPGPVLADASVLIVPRLGVGKVRSGMNDRQVIAELGEPDRKTGTGRILHYTRLGMTVVFNPNTGTVQAVFAGDDNGAGGPMTRFFRGRTREGIGMGSSREDILRAFGPPSEVQQTQAGREWLRYPSLGLNLALQGGKMTSLNMDF
jgi:RNA polymerase sigma factor (sigma-70 family)